MSLDLSLRGLARGTALVLLATVVAVLPGTSGPAVAEDPPPVVAAPYAPPAGPLFNDPAGTEAEQLAINDHLVRAIDHTPKGAYLRIALYSGSIPSFRDAVLAAYRRGVNVRLIMDGHSADTLWWDSIASVIGTDRRRGSWTTVCRYSCFDTRATTLQHAKLYTFSRTGTARHVVMAGSGNPTFAQARTGWNDLFTIVDDRTMYDAFVAYFDKMAASSKIADEVNYHRTTVSGPRRAVFFPGQFASTGDYYARVLDNIRCTAAPGSGVGGRTKVTVAMGLWSASRVRNAEKLWNLDEAGCDVEAIVSSHDLDAGVLAWLRKPGRNGGITFRAASLDFGNDGKIDRYLHEKIVMVNGGYLARKDVRLTFMGSHNFTYNAMRGNNEVVIRSQDAATYTKLEEHVRQLRAGTEVIPDPGVPVAPEVDLTQDLPDLEARRAYGD